MASKEDFKAAVREVLTEGPVLDRIALAVLKRPCYLVDPTAKSHKVVGTTTIAKKVNYLAFNFAEMAGLLRQVLENQGKAVPVLLEPATMLELEVAESVPDLPETAAAK